MGLGETASDVLCSAAYVIGQRIAEQGWVLLTGGRAIGVMDAASRGAKAAGGLTIGILPGATVDGASDYLDIPIVTGLGHARNTVNILSCDLVIACGMGLGTASEIAIALKSERPVILLACSAISCQFFEQFSTGKTHVSVDVEHAMQIAQTILKRKG
ncbi:MAG: TIGR00725 family protein [Kaiparowitsia implicata GSE-PSE-MK54-09C]|jgi:uncharacterized protein (TIGR00725 family)|nr:TIGR00725 family protein [Kaiparowitsia implicata GSE-PSE-MK54-09C]